MNKILLVALVTIFLASCGKSEPTETDAQKLGFTNLAEMRDLNSKGFKSKEDYLNSLTEAKKKEREEAEKKAVEMVDTWKKSFSNFQKSCDGVYPVVTNYGLYMTRSQLSLAADAAGGSLVCSEDTEAFSDDEFNLICRAPDALIKLGRATKDSEPISYFIYKSLLPSPFPKLKIPKAEDITPEYTAEKDAWFEKAAEKYKLSKDMGSNICNSMFSGLRSSVGYAFLNQATISLDLDDSLNGSAGIQLSDMGLQEKTKAVAKILRSQKEIGNLNDAKKRIGDKKL